MDGDTARWDGRLRRIIAVLVALAVLAERAADRSYPVRCFVLWLLRRAEAVVADFVAEATGMPQPAFAGIGTTGNEPEDALLLAARLHALAEALGVLLRCALILPPQSGWRWRGRSQRQRGATPRPGRLALTPDGLTAGPNDTS
ncbi:MAG: hypothetical protein K5872_16710 [Rhizobiaceae bacterium]|nr:hypothetical protein [Rhizobiaceae bacterium]MCV0407865.1 hypothetical protein [Rhizobiaceae bacterium]